MAPQWSLESRIVAANLTIPTIVISVGDYTESHQTDEDLMCTDHVTLTYEVTVVMCKTTIRGRYVTIKRQDDDRAVSVDDYFTMCEIEVYGKG